MICSNPKEEKEETLFREKKDQFTLVTQHTRPIQKCFFRFLSTYHFMTNLYYCLGKQL